MKKFSIKFKTKLILPVILTLIGLGIISASILTNNLISKYDTIIENLKEKSLLFVKLTDFNIEEIDTGIKFIQLTNQFEKINKDLCNLVLLSNSGEIIFSKNQKEEKCLINKKSIKKITNYNSKQEIIYPINSEKENIYLWIVKPLFKDSKNVGYLIYFFSVKLDFNFMNSILFTIFLILVFVLFGIIASLYFSNKLITPLVKLKKASEIIADGNLDYKLDLTQTDEIGEIANSFNIMATKLKDSFLNMQLQIDKVETLVGERTKQLKKAYDEIQERNSALHRELTMASRVQQAILPKNLKAFLPVRIDSVYLAMEAIGGDFFDVMQINDDKIAFLISDVTGHGISASLVTTMTKLSFTNYARFCVDTKETCKKVNDELFNYIKETRIFISAFYLIYNKKTNIVQYTNCGHHYALLYKISTKEVMPLDSNGFVLGAFDFSEYACEETKVEKGDKIFFFTDGVTEARNKEKKFFSKDRLMELYRENGHLEPAKINEIIFLKLMEFTQDVAKTDDITFLTFEAI